MPAQDPSTIGTVVADAVTQALAGNHSAGLALLQPIVDEGPSSTYVLLSCLAETAVFTVRRQHGPDCAFGIQVEAWDGSERSTDDLAPPVRFAARFMAAWANRDQDSTSALFKALAEQGDRPGCRDIGDAVSTLYGFAVTTADQLRARPHADDTDPA
ncbi:hypothetical protein [Streptomyces sp. NBC_00120]|uniref:hypothetical protein n=1 Tax=Streptomyces sp. NBC_00120 TaxID=2975660 RepID=UPI00224DFED9|nr:hypothetical protein [Streptomyces sp. NBC_00120]MCX5326348.1 hypothetical protein [Streptomyces sp. NBC_00120]